MILMRAPEYAVAASAVSQGGAAVAPRQNPP